jgi:hypothetical protein
MSATTASSVNKVLVPLAAGALFSAGVCVSGMVRPSKVIGFLDFGGAWDASLALVMASALALHVVAWAVVRARQGRGQAPPLGDAYPGPPSSVIDARLVGGALLFGFGWGLSGFCPGPAIVSVVTGVRASLVFVGSMVVAMAAYEGLRDRGSGLRSSGIAPDA